MFLNCKIVCRYCRKFKYVALWQLCSALNSFHYKEQENLFCEENIDCFINLPKNAYKPCRHLKLEIENPTKNILDYIRIELPEN